MLTQQQGLFTRVVTGLADGWAVTGLRGAAHGQHRRSSEGPGRLAASFAVDAPGLAPDGPLLQASSGSPAVVRVSEGKAGPRPWGIPGQRRPLS